MSTRMDRRTFARTGLGSAGIIGLNGTVRFAAPKPKGLRLRPFSEKFLAGLPRMMQLAAVPGVSVAYVENGRETWGRSFGVRNAETREPVAADTVWQVGSLSKPVFALSVMKLVEAGKLDLDRPLVNYVPGDLTKDDPRARSITARHALSHSTGLQNWRFQAGQSLALSFAPGERWSYSGEGIYYLQRAVEQITGQSLEQFAHEQIFTPLQMTNSSYSWLPAYDRRIATAHNGQGAPAVDYLVQNAPRLAKIAEEQKKPVAEWRHEDQEKAQASIETRFPPFPTFFPVNAAGSLIATVSDYAKFLIAVIGGATKPLLNETSSGEMLKPQMRINDTVSWALGWGLQADNGRNYFWHWGEGINYRTFVMADRASRSGIIVFTNGRNGRKIWERIVIEATGSDQPLLLWL